MEGPDSGGLNMMATHFGARLLLLLLLPALNSHSSRL